MERLKVLHLTTHLGGGIGTVVLSYLSKVINGPFEHEVLCLNYADRYSIKTSKKIGLKLSDHMYQRISEVLDSVAKADIVLIHWWNHPLMADFLVRNTLPASRVILWSHIMGSTPPQNFTNKILKYPDIFVFTTPISLNIKEVKRLPEKYKKSLRVIWSTGGIERLKLIKPKRHAGFNIGYIGTIDFSKMHPNFLNISSKVKIPNSTFIVIGGPNEEELKQKATRLGVDGKFQFTGFLPKRKTWEYLSSLDVFGYLLAPHHYGTCDQSLQESMAAGVVPVVLANPMESYMVKNGITGIVVKNQTEYIKALHDLYHNHKLRKVLSKNARQYAQNFSLEKMIAEWDKVFKEALRLPKTQKRWKINRKNKLAPKDIFLESLGSYGKVFASYCNSKTDEEKERALKKIIKLGQLPRWQSETKSTVHNFNSFLPGDNYLAFWSKMMRKAQTNYQAQNNNV